MICNELILHKEDDIEIVFNGEDVLIKNIVSHETSKIAYTGKGSYLYKPKLNYIPPYRAVQILSTITPEVLNFLDKQLKFS